MATKFLRTDRKYGGKEGENFFRVIETSAEKLPCTIPVTRVVMTLAPIEDADLKKKVEERFKELFDSGNPK